MLLVRPAGPADLDSLMELAVLSGRGFTSLPADEAVLAERLALAEQSFSGAIAPAEAWYTLMLEDTASGMVVGISAVALIRRSCAAPFLIPRHDPGAIFGCHSHTLQPPGSGTRQRMPRLD